MPWIIAVIGLIAAAGLLFVIYRSKDRRGLGMHCVWTSFLEQGLSNDADEKKLRATLRQNENFSSRVYKELMDIESESLKQPDSLRYIRNVLIDTIDLNFLAQVLMDSDNKKRAEIGRKTGDDFSNQALVDLFLKSKVTVPMLRAYGIANYGDGRANDWFAHYLFFARKHFEKLKQTLDREGSEKFLARYNELKSGELRMFRDSCLESEAGGEFKASDAPV